VSFLWTCANGKKRLTRRFIPHVPGIIFFNTSKKRRPFLARSTPTTGRRGLEYTVQWLNARSTAPNTATMKYSCCQSWLKYSCTPS
jgi:hypothetical protein